MNILEALEKYQAPSIHDKSVFDLLAAIALLGPIDSNDLKEKIKSESGFDNKKLIQLYKSGIILTNYRQQWCISDAGVSLLSKVGVSQIAASSVAADVLGRSYPNWLQYLVKSDRDVDTTSSIYQRFKCAKWVTNRVGAEKNESPYIILISGLYLSEMSGFHESDSESFYETLFDKTIRKEVDKGQFKKTYALCKNLTEDSNDLLNLKVAPSKPFSWETYVFTFVRLLSSALTKTKDFGITSSVGMDKEYSLWDQMSNWRHDSSKLCSDYMKEHSNQRSNVELEKIIGKLIQQKLESADFELVRKFELINSSLSNKNNDPT